MKSVSGNCFSAILGAKGALAFLMGWNIVAQIVWSVTHIVLSCFKTVCHFITPTCSYSQSITYQAVLASSSNTSYVYYFYGDMQWGEFSNIGFNPSFAIPNSRSFMIPIALTSETVDIESTSNVEMPGVYAFRVDRSLILQPGGGLTDYQESFG